MAVKRTQYQKNAIYFCTITCYKWLHLFEITNLYYYLYSVFGTLKDKYGCYLNGYVIMPNHIHLLIYVGNESPIINEVIGNSKRFIAYEIIKRLHENAEHSYLEILSNGVNNSDRKNGKKHQVFQPSFDAKLCFNQQMIEEKLKYMHLNPVSKNWSLANNYVEYKHSSCRFYQLGEKLGVDVFHYNEFL